MNDTPSSFEFTCRCCGNRHAGIPTFAWDCPVEALFVPRGEWPNRVMLTSETCIIDGAVHFLRGCVLIPVEGVSEPFIWGMWPRIDEAAFHEYARGLNARALPESRIPGRLGSVPPGYPDAELDVWVDIKPIGTRPELMIIDTGHPFGADQQRGISQQSLQEIAERLLHPERKPRPRWWWPFR